jgi:hypothetical protein
MIARPHKDDKISQMLYEKLTTHHNVTSHQSFCTNHISSSTITIAPSRH